MLVKITNQCHAGCSHCMEDSTPRPGQHMTMDTFERALGLTERVDGTAWMLGCPTLVLLSGGECTEHPEIVQMIEKVVERGWVPFLITNGLWLGDEALRTKILRPEWDRLLIQVTNDSRFYPKPVPRVEDPRITYVDSLTALLPLGRALRKRGIEDMGLPLKKAPSSFNLRSLTRSYGDIRKAVAMLRARSLLGQAGQCTPSITHEGNVMAGESRVCFKIGTVDSSCEALTRALVKMRCNACGLVDNLSLEQKRAIGESSLFAGNE